MLNLISDHFTAKMYFKALSCLLILNNWLHITAFPTASYSFYKTDRVVFTVHPCGFKFVPDFSEATKLLTSVPTIVCPKTDCQVSTLQSKLFERVCARNWAFLITTYWTGALNTLKDLELNENPSNTNKQPEHRLPLKIMASPILPQIYHNSAGEIVGGAHYTILTTVLRHLNYTWTVDMKGGGTGSLKNGTWTGMTGAVLYKKANVSLLTSATAARYKVIDIIWVGQDSILFLTRVPSSSADWTAIFHPFSALLWAMFGVTFIATGLTLYVQLAFAGEKKNRLYWSILLPYKITLEQGFSQQIPTEIKLFISVWMMYVLNMNTVYRSDLVTFFTVPQEESIPRSFIELDERKDYSVRFNYLAGTSYNYFMNSSRKPAQSLFPRFELERSTAKCIVAAAIEKRTVCISWSAPTRTVSSGNLSFPGSYEPLVTISEPIVSFYTGFALPKNSPLTQEMGSLIGRLQSAGLTSRWYELVYRNFSIIGRSWMATQGNSTLYKTLERQQDESNQSGAKAFNIDNVAGSLIVLGTGYIIIAICFGLELLRHHRFQNLNLRVDNRIKDILGTGGKWRRFRYNGATFSNSQPKGTREISRIQVGTNLSPSTPVKRFRHVTCRALLRHLTLNQTGNENPKCSICEF